jgi:hypothetical protein
MPSHTRTTLFSALVAATASCKAVPTSYTDGGGHVAAEKGKTYAYDFDGATPGQMPEELIDVLGTWTVDAEPSAPSAPHVLRQHAQFGNPDFPRVILRDLDFTDLVVRVRCRPEAGGTDQACGVMFRTVDSYNYMLVRANALEDNVNLYRSVAADRMELASASAKVASGVWHMLEVSAHGAEIRVRFDDQEVLAASNATFTTGKIGLWTKADSITAFDDFQATAE